MKKNVQCGLRAKSALQHMALQGRNRANRVILRPSLNRRVSLPTPEGRRPRRSSRGKSDRVSHVEGHHHHSPLPLHHLPQQVSLTAPLSACLYLIKTGHQVQNLHAPRVGCQLRRKVEHPLETHPDSPPDCPKQQQQLHRFFLTKEAHRMAFQGGLEVGEVVMLR